MKQITTILFILFFSFSIKAQVTFGDIKNVKIETYYISDAKDATDTTGGKLEAGSVTYRIYIQMKPGCMLTQLYGDARHALKISSTANFFNNIDRGQIFGDAIKIDTNTKKSQLYENTAALDTWITLGKTSTKYEGITHFGILKSQDTDGSFIGGVNNDGGSAAIEGGLLANNNPNAGIPLTKSDGMAVMTNVPTWQTSFGITDTTIFGSKVGSEFSSNDASIISSGVAGVVPDSNEVLVAQLTTTGEISFELNVVVLRPDGTTMKYVANGIDTLDEKLCPYLKYPHDCGCNDPGYFEFNKKYLCLNLDSCKTKIIMGCMDPNACNYDPNANFNVQSTCCYPGMCSGRDISVVCPDLGSHVRKIRLYPNPANEILNVNILNMNSENAVITIYDIYGKKLIEKSINNNSDNITQEVDLSTLIKGVYYVHVKNNDGVNVTNFFVKN